MNLELLLVVVAAVIAVIQIVEAKGRAWLAWAVLCLAVFLLLPALT